jgi:serine/threonine-protein kinase SRPK3
MLDKWAFGMSKIDGDDGGGAGGSKPSSFGATTEDRRYNSNSKDKMDSTERAAEGISNVSLEPDRFVENASHKANHLQPSLFTQRVSSPSKKAESSESELHYQRRAEPPPPPPHSARSTTNSMAVDSELDGAHNAETAVYTERITVKIADLGNGKSLWHFWW